MDDGRIRSRNRDVGLSKAGRHRSPHPIARTKSTPSLDTVDYGHHLLPVTYSYGHDIAAAVYTPESALDPYNAEKLLAAVNTGGSGFLG